MKTDIIVHMPIHGRKQEARMAMKALTRTLDEFADLGYSSHVCVVGSSQRDQQLAKQFGFEYIHASNQPLGRKFNSLVQHIMRNHDFTWFMEYCSDNVIATGYAAKAHAAIEAGARGVVLQYFYCVELKGKECKLFGPGNSNVGRLTHADHVRNHFRTTGHLYPVYKERRLDQAFRRFMVKGQRVEYVGVDSAEDVMLLDVKGPANINPMSNFRNYDSVPLKGEFSEYYEINSAWQPQEKSVPTKLESTSPPPSTPTTTPESAERTETAQPMNRTPLNSSPARPAAASARPRKSSKPRRKTTTGKGKS